MWPTFWWALGPWIEAGVHWTFRCSINSHFPTHKTSFLSRADLQSLSSFSAHYCLANNVIYAWDIHIKMQCSYSNCHNYYIELNGNPLITQPLQEKNQTENNQLNNTIETLPETTVQTVGKVMSWLSFINTHSFGVLHWDEGHWNVKLICPNRISNKYLWLFLCLYPLLKTGN